MRKKISLETARSRIIENLLSGFFWVENGILQCPHSKLKCRECNFVTNVNKNECDCSWFPVRDKFKYKLRNGLRMEFPEYFI